MADQLMPGLTALIVGKRNSGKSILLFDIMSNMAGWFSYGLALSPTQGSRQKFGTCMPSMFIDKQSPERLENYVKLVNNTYDKDIARGRTPRKTYLICDDTAFDDKFMRCTTLQEIFLNGRQFGTTCIVAVQYVMKCSPSLRSNADFVFCFWDNNKKNQEKIHEYWFNMMPRKVFLEVFSECTKDYGVLVMDIRASATSRDWHDCVFWYKADPEVPAFTFCDPDFFLMADYCAINEMDGKRMQAETRDRVWRLGPDGRPFDAPSYVTRPGDHGYEDEDAEGSEFDESDGDGAEIIDLDRHAAEDERGHRREITHRHRHHH